MQTKVEQPAQGVQGVLIRSAVDNQIWFRVYDQDHEFRDYEITNHDCEIEILDPHAALISTEAGDFLDYTTEALGESKG